MPSTPGPEPAISETGTTPIAGGHHHAIYSGSAVLIWHCDIKHRGRKRGRSLEACRIAQEKGEAAWKFVAWPRAKEGGRKQFSGTDVGAAVFLFWCKSWRCPGICRDYVFRRDMRRILEALEKRPRWLFVVLTLSPKRWKSGRDAAYKKLYLRWQQLRARLRRWLGRKIDYIGTVEQHTEKIAGWPHINLVLSWSGMEDVKDFDGYARGIRRWLKDNAPSCGFGFSVECEPMRSAKNVAGYMAGASVGKKGNGPYKDKALRQLAGEILKKNRQVPVSAPLNFRRIRASRGLLPPLETSNGEWAIALAQSKTPEAFRGLRDGGRGGKPPGDDRGSRGRSRGPGG